MSHRKSQKVLMYRIELANAVEMGKVEEPD